jgi:hypothetical protein
MVSEKLEKKRGFTTVEKWIIWGVFCLLVGLSTYRFTVFLGLMVLPFGFNLVFKSRTNAKRITLGIIVSLFGLVLLVFSHSLS